MVHLFSKCVYFYKYNALWKKFEHDRDGYTDAKCKFIKRYTKIAKEKFIGRY